MESWEKLLNPFDSILQDRIAVSKKDSLDWQIQKSPEALPKKGGVRAILVRQGHQAMRGQIDEGIAQHQGSGGIVEKSGFALAGAGQGDQEEPIRAYRHLRPFF